MIRSRILVLGLLGATAFGVGGCNRHRAEERREARNDSEGGEELRTHARRAAENAGDAAEEAGDDVERAGNTIEEAGDDAVD